MQGRGRDELYLSQLFTHCGIAYFIPSSLQRSAESRRQGTEAGKTTFFFGIFPTHSQFLRANQSNLDSRTSKGAKQSNRIAASSY